MRKMAYVLALIGTITGYASEEELRRTQEKFIEFGKKVRGEVIQINTPFAADEVSFIHQQGNNTVSGSAFMRQGGGGIVTCAGKAVFLVPEGGHSRERIEKFYEIVEEHLTTYIAAIGISDMAVGYGKRLPPPSEEYLAATLGTPCDASGKFSFEGLADGSYFIMVEVLWHVGNIPQGGLLMTPVTIEGGVHRKVVMSQ